MIQSGRHVRQAYDIVQEHVSMESFPGPMESFPGRHDIVLL